MNSAQSEMDRASWSAFAVTIFGFSIPLIFLSPYILPIPTSILSIFTDLGISQPSIFNYFIVSISCCIMFFLFHLVLPNTLSPYYPVRSYFYFFLTSCCFGQIVDFCVKSILSTGTATPLLSLKIFLISNVLYHFGEFYFVAFCHPKNLSWSSFLINHSTGYTAAILTAFTEYLIGTLLFPSFFLSQLHDNLFLIVIGICMSIFGHFMRMGAFVVARSNFNHLVQTHKQQGHQLVTSGVYQLSRHPSYLGFFSYSIGGQIILGNVFSLIAYSAVLFRFFLFRIVEEEFYLVKFFGEDYVQYRNKVPIRIPFLENAIKRKFPE